MNPCSVRTVLLGNVPEGKSGISLGARRLNPDQFVFWLLPHNGYGFLGQPRMPTDVA